MSQQEIPFALIRWIKAQQERDAHFERVLAVRNQKDDEYLLGLIRELVRKRLLKQKNIMFINSLVEYKETGRNWSPAQKSAIAKIYYDLVS